MRVLYVGDLTPGGTCLQRLEAMAALGHQLYPVNTRAAGGTFAPGVLRSRLQWKLFRLGVSIAGPLDLSGANERLLTTLAGEAFDVLWIDKGLTIEAETLRRVKQLRPGCLVVGYSGDDMYARHNQSRQFLAHLPLYDCYFTTKSYGVQELQRLGCPRVEFVGNAFDPNLHRPVAVSADERACLGGEVGFIGFWERERSESIHFLAGAGIRVGVWGDGWQKHLRGSSGPVLRGPARYGQDYVRILCSFDINLCFLRKINRDRQTTRSIEIPACGAFMLAERTDEHLALFREGEEAAFFGSNEELLEKVRYYLANPRERQRIAAAGRERCLRSGYSTHDRLRWMLERATGARTCRPGPPAPQEHLAAARTLVEIQEKTPEDAGGDHG